MSWGILPEAAQVRLRFREWDNSARRKAHLQGQIEYPIRLSLKPPSGKQALADINHFQTFLAAWSSLPGVLFELKRYRSLGEQNVPIAVEFHTFQEIVGFLGEQAQIEHWQGLMQQICQAVYPSSLHSSAKNVLINHLFSLEQYSQLDLSLLMLLLPQLKAGLGVGGYLRALPVSGVDTKFVETHQTLIEALSDVLHEGAVLAAGGLLPWLECLESPKGWLWVRPLCDRTRSALASLPLLQLDSETLQYFELPAQRILIIENLQSGLGLPDMPDTIAVAGGGKNLTWLDAPWSMKKRLGYWGDIDTDGLLMLSQARTKVSHIEPLMMDLATFQNFSHHGVEGHRQLGNLPLALTQEEARLFEYLVNTQGVNRLEQERLPSDYVRAALSVWIDS